MKLQLLILAPLFVYVWGKAFFGGIVGNLAAASETIISIGSQAHEYIEKANNIATKVRETADSVYKPLAAINNGAKAFKDTFGNKGTIPQPETVKDISVFPSDVANGPKNGKTLSILSQYIYISLKKFSTKTILIFR